MSKKSHSNKKAKTGTKINKYQVIQLIFLDKVNFADALI